MPRRTISGVRRLRISGAGLAAPAPWRDSLQRAKSASYIFIRIARRQAPARSSGHHADGQDAMQVKPMMGMETRPIAPASPSDGRDVQ
ncbi:hypothetical protein BCEP27_31183 [Burkholderia cepacia]|nr:hypothetical protein [Burkholderia cepacia]